MTMEYDVFISHASEDKKDVALPLASHLQKQGLRVWIDETELELGDSLRRKIDHGLSQSKFGVVILSPAFFSKEWPNKELDALVAREDGKEKVILPIWHNIGAGEIVSYSPILASKLAVSTQKGIEFVANSVGNVVSKPREKSNLNLKHIGPTEEEVLKNLSHQMLMANSSRELRKTLYELDEYMAKYPHSPQARMLKDRIVLGIQRAEKYESQATLSSDSDILERRSMRMRGPRLFWRLIIWICILATLGFLLFHWLN